MLQEKYRVYITINKEWFYKVPESIVTAGSKLFEGLNFIGADYSDDSKLQWAYYDKMVNGSDIPKIMSNYENFPLYGEADVAKISLSIEHCRQFDKPQNDNEED